MGPFNGPDPFFFGPGRMLGRSNPNTLTELNGERAFREHEPKPLHGDDTKLRIERIAAVELPSSQAFLFR